MNLIKTNKSQNNFINELKLNKPKIILYKSEKFDFGNTSALTIIDDYIRENYVFHSKFDFWTFFKIKK